MKSKVEYFKAMHESARESAAYERYMQATVHDFADRCCMAGEDAEAAPRWVRALPLSIIHGAYWPLVFWWRRRYLSHLLDILWVEALRVLVCEQFGHAFEDTGSWGGPESGGEDMTCKRCGFHFHHTYY